MNQPSTSTHPFDLETLRLQLENFGKEYFVNLDSTQAREQLLHTLQTNDCREILAAIVDGDDLAGVFVVAAFRSHVDILEALLNHGMNVDIKNKDDWTALIHASCNNQEECVHFLLDRHASVDVQDYGGYTALMYASECGHTKVVEMLLEKNANPDLQNKSGRTALMTASSYGQDQIVQLLLNHNADIDLMSTFGMTALGFTNDEKIKEMIRNHVTSSYVLK